MAAYLTNEICRHLYVVYVIFRMGNRLSSRESVAEALDFHCQGDLEDSVAAKGNSCPYPCRHSKTHRIHNEPEAEEQSCKQKNESKNRGERIECGNCKNCADAVECCKNQPDTYYVKECHCHLCRRKIEHPYSRHYVYDGHTNIPSPAGIDSGCGYSPYCVKNADAKQADSKGHGNYRKCLRG